MKIFCSLTAFLISLFLYISPLFAVGTQTINGLAVVNIDKGIRVTRFNGYTLGTSNAYVYNDSGSSTPSTAGALDIITYRIKGVRINITNLLDAGTTTLGIFHADGTTTTWNAAAEATYSGTQSASFPITENAQFQRIGIKRSGDFAGSVTVTEIYLTE